jgi:glutamine amidotransferase-like uncharacterized protein
LKPAIIHIKYKSGNVILSGIHYEYTPSTLDKKDPYLKEIIPALEASDKDRKILFEDLFLKLGVKPSLEYN